MKTKAIFYMLISVLGLVSCEENITDKEQLYNTSWELEYISGTRIAFEGLYPDKKPILTFDKSTNRVSGNNSCNGYATDVTLEDDQISFGEPGITTMMYCGEGENQFLNMMKKVNKFGFDQEGKLLLYHDDVVLLKFHKADKTTEAHSNPSSMTTQHQTSKSYFKAAGTEPFWSLHISEKQISFTTPSDSIITPYAKPIAAMDNNVKTYKVATEAHMLHIQISQKECTNAMSGEVSPYSVTIDYGKTNTMEPTHVEGCGQYITDYRLHDIWVLTTLNGMNMTTDHFAKELPNIEINTTKNRFAGYAGCNRMTGQIFFEKHLLRFTNVAMTKKMCPGSNQERQFLEALKKVTRYNIENNQLILSNPDEELLILKKAD
ncbi:MAG: META domain-containing protein [Algicola sp.]|nr:META domain-containing protein [Algicola sp.]